MGEGLCLWYNGGMEQTLNSKDMKHRGTLRWDFVYTRTRYYAYCSCGWIGKTYYSDDYEPLQLAFEGLSDHVKDYEESLNSVGMSARQWAEMQDEHHTIRQSDGEGGFNLVPLPSLAHFLGRLDARVAELEDQVRELSK